MDKILQQIDQWAESHRAEMIKDIAEIIAIPSKRGEAAPDAPFGPEPKRALHTALAMCERYGFATKNHENYVGTALLNDGPACLDILAHLDVVHEGTGWDSDPFTLVEKGDYLFGRGTADDKGPAITALYAMRAVKELGLPVSKNVRLILGTDEECGSGDLEYFFQHETSAPHSFTPDSSFPVLNTEKGRYHPTFTYDLPEETALPRVISLNGGTTLNIVTEYAHAEILGMSAEEVLKIGTQAAEDHKVGLTAENIEGGCKVTVHGTPAHAASPELGINANTALIDILNLLPLADTASTEMLKKLPQLLPHGDTEGKALGIAQEDEASGKLSLSFNIMRMENGHFKGDCDGRVPMCADDSNCKNVGDAKFRSLGFGISSQTAAAHHVPADDPFIQILLGSYEKVTGEKGYCLSTGGGTYVHHIEGGVAFGPEMPGCDNRIHGANENIKTDHLVASVKMFAYTIANLCK